jgi:hypothetical protein
MDFHDFSQRTTATRASIASWRAWLMRAATLSEHPQASMIGIL